MDGEKFLIAAESGYLDVIKGMLEEKIHPDEPRNQVKFNIKLLDFTILPKNKATLLQLAAYAAHVEIVELLLENEADVDIQNLSGGTGEFSSNIFFQKMPHVGSSDVCSFHRKPEVGC